MQPNSSTRPVVEQMAVAPTHVAVIMDGNGRWAAERGLPRAAGHRAGTENVRGIIESCVEVGVRILTLYAFSTENWQRPYEEIDALFAILSDVIDRETQELCRQGVQIRHIGTLDRVPRSLADRIRHAVDLTQQNDRLIVNVAFNYGSRAEIVRAVRQIVAQGVDPSEVDEELIARYLDTSGLPDPDLIIRTAGEARLSNFLLWQAAYAEYFWTDVYWPDFDVGRFRDALEEFGRRQRRFGGLTGPARRNGS
jgi:undecaprenyl diphosphate synthase